MNKISQTKLKLRTKRKTNPEIVELLSLMRQNTAWNPIAKVISSSTRNYSSVNLHQIDSESKEGDTIVVPGKILSSGKITKKLKLCALSISSTALDKLKESKSEFVPLMEEVKKNKKAEGVKIIK